MARTDPGFVLLVHTVTGAESNPVAESTVPMWEAKGWRRIEADPLTELVRISEDLGLYDDVPEIPDPKPSKRTAPAPLASPPAVETPAPPVGDTTPEPED